jgi:hypothetical protein
MWERGILARGGQRKKERRSTQVKQRAGERKEK